jgi:thioredoxin-like negative regulator of GroEL
MLQVGTVTAEAATTPAQPLSYTEAYAEAERGDKPLVVMIGAEWCPACVQMKKTAIPQAAKDDVFKEVAFTMIDADRQGDIARQMMEGSSIPQLLMFRKTADGWQREKLTGGNSASAIVSFLRRGVQAAGRMVK